MIEIADYDPRWARAFSELQDALAGILGPLAVAIEHVGSTAVPGLAAKPIIDIDVVVSSRDKLTAVIAALVTAGYQHQGDLGILGREAFKRREANVPKDGSGRLWPAHHLYVCDKYNQELQRHLAFRDFLRSNPGWTQRYGELKRRLALDHADDRLAYVEGKAAFVNEALLAAPR